MVTSFTITWIAFFFQQLLNQLFHSSCILLLASLLCIQQFQLTKVSLRHHKCWKALSQRDTHNATSTWSIALRLLMLTVRRHDTVTWHYSCQEIQACTRGVLGPHACSCSGSSERKSWWRAQEEEEVSWCALPPQSTARGLPTAPTSTRNDAIHLDLMRLIAEQVQLIVV